MIVDGIEWDVPIGVSRTMDMTPSEVSGMMLDRSYLNDVIGTYPTYEVVMAIPPSMEDGYFDIFEALTEPTDHEITLPYNDGTITMSCRVESVKDRLVLVGGERQLWRGLTFTAISNWPVKAEDLESAIARGRSLPPSVSYPLGTLLMATEIGWVEVSYPDADVRRY